jgi:hypothetical protein
MGVDMKHAYKTIKSERCWMKNEEVYIGDGVYASYDGYQFLLRTKRAHGWDEIYLEANVLEAFESYVASIRARESMLES